MREREGGREREVERGGEEGERGTGCSEVLCMNFLNVHNENKRKKRKRERIGERERERERDFVAFSTQLLVDASEAKT